MTAKAAAAIASEEVLTGFQAPSEVEPSVPEPSAASSSSKPKGDLKGKGKGIRNKGRGKANAADDETGPKRVKKCDELLGPAIMLLHARTTCLQTISVCDHN